MTWADLVKAYQAIPTAPWHQLVGKVGLRVSPWLDNGGVFLVKNNLVAALDPDLPECCGQVIVMDPKVRQQVADVPDAELAAIVAWMMITRPKPGRTN